MPTNPTSETIRKDQILFLFETAISMIFCLHYISPKTKQQNKTALIELQTELNQVVNQHAVEIKTVVQKKEQEHEIALKEQKIKHQNLLEQHEETKKNLSAEIQTLAKTNNATKKETDGCMKEVLDQHAVEIKTIVQKKEQEHETALEEQKRVHQDFLTGTINFITSLCSVKRCCVTATTSLF